MDDDNLNHLRGEADEDHHAKISLLLDYAETGGLREVPDPYYGGLGGFEKVLDLVEQASRGLLDEVRKRL